MGKLVRGGGSLEFGTLFREDRKAGNNDALKDAIIEGLSYALYALRWDLNEQDIVLNFPATISLKMEVDKWDGQVKATLEWPDEGGFLEEHANLIYQRGSNENFGRDT